MRVVLCRPSASSCCSSRRAAAVPGLLGPEEQRARRRRGRRSRAGLAAEAGLDAEAEAKRSTRRATPVARRARDRHLPGRRVDARLRPRGDNTLSASTRRRSGLTTIGTIACPGASTPFSMAVDRRGIALLGLRGRRPLPHRHGERRLPADDVRAGPARLRHVRHGLRREHGRRRRDALRRRGERVERREAELARPRDDRHDVVRASVVGDFEPAHPRPGADRAPPTGGSSPSTRTPPGAGRTSSRSTRRPGASWPTIRCRWAAPRDAYAFAFWGGEFWVFTRPRHPGAPTRSRASTPRLRRRPPRRLRRHDRRRRRIHVRAPVTATRGRSDLGHQRREHVVEREDRDDARRRPPWPSPRRRRARRRDA